MHNKNPAFSDGELCALQHHLEDIEPATLTTQRLSECLQNLIHAGLDRLPLPGEGTTLNRWRALTCVAAHDLSLVKLYEGHTDALAIMAELHAGEPKMPPASRWGVWAAEPPHARVMLSARPDGGIELTGRKAWCSGAPVLSHALLTAWNGEQQQCLVAVSLDQPEIQVSSAGWQAIGMAASASVDVIFDGASGTLIGAPGAYTDRRGFWYGGAGIAACWYGAAAAIGDALRARIGHGNDPHKKAHLGAVDAALRAAAAVLRETAASFDQGACADAAREALLARAVVENAVESIIRHTGRALGASPFCRDARFARLMADLPVFVRQSHAERDLETLGQATAQKKREIWTL